MRRIVLFSAMVFASMAISFAQTPGTLKWRLTVDGDVSYSSPGLAPDGTLYIGRANLAGGGTLWAINTAAVPTGNSPADAYARWKVGFTNISLIPSDTPAIGTNGTIYLATDTNVFSAINPTNGVVRWSYNDSQSQSFGIQGSPAIAPDGSVYIGIWENVIALTNSPDVTNAAPEWVFQYPFANPDVALGTGGFQHGSPAVGADGTVYINSDFGQLFAITNGELKWVSALPDFTVYFGSGLSGSPAIGPDGTIYFGTGNYFLAVDPATGTYSHSAQTFPDDAFQTGPVIGPDGTIYIEVFGVTNRLYAFNPDLSVKWTNTLAKLENQTVDTIAKQGSCAVASNAVYVTDTDGTIYSFDPQSGHTNWTYATGASGLNAPAIGPDGTIYVSSYEASQPYVYALYGNPPATNSSWPQFRKDAQRTAVQTQAPSGPVTIGAPVMTTNGFQFTITGPDGLTVTIEASDDLVTWTIVGSVTLTGGTGTFVDSASGSHPHRYYREASGTSSNVSITLSSPLRIGGSFQFSITGPAGKTANVDASPNLSTWTNIGSVFLTNGSAIFVDSSANSFSRRFYRATAQ